MTLTEVLTRIESLTGEPEPLPRIYAALYQAALFDSEVETVLKKVARLTGNTLTVLRRDWTLYCRERQAQEQEVVRHTNGARRPTSLPLSDYTNALAFIADHGEDVRYCYPWNAWLVWTGTHWERDTSGDIMRRAKSTIKRLARQIERMDDEAKIEALMRHIKSSLSTAKLKAMVESAQSEPGVSVQPDELDRNPWVLNCANCTVDLHTGMSRPHARQDLLTKCLSVGYDPEATCPTWDAFQWRIMGGTIADPEAEENLSGAAIENRIKADTSAQELIAFKQRFIGYTLTGTTTEQCLCFYYGSGSNGKTTELETLQAMLGSYALSTPSATLLVKDTHGEGIPNDIARLRGARLVTAVEIGEGRRLNEELVKRLTGHDTLTARFLREEFFDFQPEFKLIVGCNHLPPIRGTDHAMWRRIKCIPFNVTIPDAEQNKDLPGHLLAELPGILRWAVAGCLAWQAEGLRPPVDVLATTEDYRSVMDVLGRFLEECCVEQPQARVKMGVLYDVYKKWCDQGGEYTMTLTAFGTQLEERGFPKRSSNGIWRLGIGLSAPEEGREA